MSSHCWNLQCPVCALPMVYLSAIPISLICKSRSFFSLLCHCGACLLFSMRKHTAATEPLIQEALAIVLPLFNSVTRHVLYDILYL